MMVPGVVYVLSNPAMPGLVKVGRTIALEPRVQSLSALTAVPAPFSIEYASDMLDDASAVELLAHSMLSECRYSPNREFFVVSSKDAADTVQAAAVMAAWNRACPEAREIALAQIGADYLRGAA